MTRAKAEKIKKGIDDKIRKTTVDMEWWAYFWGFTVGEYEEFLDLATEALQQETVSRESYNHEFNLRKELEMKVVELENSRARKIIRCKDCKYAKPFLERYHCNKLDEDWEISFEANHYCSFAEPKGSDEE